jgi:metal-sulfur cluster biosynthetic enzyme
MDERELGTTVEEHSGETPASVTGAASDGIAAAAGETGRGAQQAGENTGVETGAADQDGPTSERVLEALKQVYDPELGINIVDLGLVYDVAISEEGDVDIQYTLTTMGCPIGPMIEDQIRAFLAPIPGLNEVRPEMVLRPPWTPEMMSDEAKAALGVF